MKRLIALAIVIVLASGALLFFRREILAMMNPKKDHPGTILTVENPGGKETVQNAEDVPLRHRFVFLKDGKEVATREEAQTVIPIVRVDVFKGPDGAILEIHEQGANGQSLRRTYGNR